ncbi:MAG: hypothetical protein AAGI09_02775 [Pseudomonadota bacterium]
MQRACEGWGASVPDWIEALVNACDEAHSQRLVAERIGVSVTMVSQAISNTYASPLDSLESRVRDIYLSDQVDCPGQGTISSETCLNWRDTAVSDLPLNPLRARMRRACFACPIFKGETP